MNPNLNSFKKIKIIKETEDRMTMSIAKRSKLPKTKSFDDIRDMAPRDMLRGKIF